MSGDVSDACVNACHVVCNENEHSRSRSRMAMSLEEFINSKIIGPETSTGAGVGAGFRAKVYFHKQIQRRVHVEHQHQPVNMTTIATTTTTTTTKMPVQVTYTSYTYTYADAYMIALFGDRAPLTKARAEAMRLIIREELQRNCNDDNCKDNYNGNGNSNAFRWMERGSWTISNPRPVSLLPIIPAG